MLRNKCKLCTCVSPSHVNQTMRNCGHLWEKIDSCLETQFFVGFVKTRYLNKIFEINLLLPLTYLPCRFHCSVSPKSPQSSASTGRAFGDVASPEKDILLIPRSLISCQGPHWQEDDDNDDHCHLCQVVEGFRLPSEDFVQLDNQARLGFVHFHQQSFITVWINYNQDCRSEIMRLRAPLHYCMWQKAKITNHGIMDIDAVCTETK